MYNFIKGSVEEILFDGICIETSGIGYLIHIPKRSVFEIKEGQELKVYTTLIHKEDSMKLFGFIYKEEREIFKLLTSVSGVGAKTALGILSEFTTFEIISSIYSNDAKKLSKAPGIGLKTAQRLILELKEKIAKLKAEIPINATKDNSSNDKTEIYEETEITLLALGYTNSEIDKALKWVLTNFANLNKSDDIIRECLVWLSNS